MFAGIAGINPKGTVTGNSFDTNFVSHGFVRASTGTFTTFDPAGSLFTNPVSINPEGLITGNYCDATA